MKACYYSKSLHDQGLHSMPRISVHPNADQAPPLWFQGHRYEIDLDKWTLLEGHFNTTGTQISENKCTLHLHRIFM